MAGTRTNKTFSIKTLRFEPGLLSDMEYVLYLAHEGGVPKYPSLNNLVVVAITKLITEERRKLEKEGVVWEHLRQKSKQITKE